MGTFINEEELKEIEISLSNHKSLKTYCKLFNFTKFLYYLLLLILLFGLYKSLM